MSSAGKFGWLTALLRHEARQLWHNRPAVFVILLLAFAPVVIRLKVPDADSEHYDCYIVYWQEDDWVRKLRESSQHESNRRLRISVIPAKKLAGTDGVISYPAGAHSIQMRPLAPSKNGRPRWMIWCWYAGSNPETMQPYTRWFWNVTQRHFDEGPAWTVRYSSLKPHVSSPIAGTELQQNLTRMPGQTLQIGLLMLAMFFCACYLPALGLTQDRSQQTILSVVLTPAGWSGIAIAKWSFHFGLALFVAMVIVLIANPSAFASLQTWSTLIFATAAFLGLGFMIGSLCKSATSAGAAMVGYALLAGGLLYISIHATNAWPSFLVIERNVFVSMLHVWNLQSDVPSGVGSLAALLGIAVVWQVVAVFCYRRCSRG